MFPSSWRQQALDALDTHFDLVILGGGINGCGIFFDAAQRGLRVLLVEKDDLAAGTSSRSSKLIHGGLRYLKQMQFKVTRDSCRERDRHLRLDPHLVDPLDFVYPAYRGDKTPGWQVEIGLFLYDQMTRTPDRHRRMSRAELRDAAPGLHQEELDRALVYRDARVDDARLTLAVAATGAAYGGFVLTRASAEGAIRGADGRIRGAVVRDLLDGSTHSVESHLVVNASGAWVDETRHRFGLDGQTIRPSRGAHILFARDRLKVEAALTVPSPDDGRPVFCVPHPEGVLVGTTDLFHDGPLDDPRATREEVDYLLRATARIAGDDAPTADDIEGVFAGLRPVLDQGADDPTAASREESTLSENGLLSVAGGKLTTWRLTAELAVDEALELLPAERSKVAAPCATAGTPLAGLAPRGLAGRLVRAHELDPAVAAGMARRLLANAWLACRHETELDPLAPGLDLCAAEVRTHLRWGAVVHLSDLLLRRIRLGMWRPRVATELAPRLRHLVCAETGWDHDRWDREMERFERDLGGWSPAGVEAA
ncbi:MAG: glycerol-3-phosphate dehydrogenase/oxidase [Acidobacteriota bacterium]